MDIIPVWMHKILSQKATVHIYSFPNFILETFMAVIVCLIYGILHIEVSKISNKCTKLKPHRLICKPAVNASASKDSFCTSITQIRHEFYKLNGKSSTTTHLTYKEYCKSNSSHSRLGWILSQRTGDSIASMSVKPYIEDRQNYIDTLLALSPVDFIKMDKDRKIRVSQLQNCLKSLTTLYDNIVKKQYSEELINGHLNIVKENIKYIKMNSQPIQYFGFEAEAMTKSLFHLLERIIAKSSIQNPLPFKGDITTLALEVGNLLPQNSDKLENEDSEGSQNTNITTNTTNTGCTLFTEPINPDVEYIPEEKQIEVPYI